MNEERYILFDQYLQGELTVDEKANFEKQLSEDQEFSAEFEAFQIAQQQLENKFGIAAAREAFKENLMKISDNHFNKNKSKVIALKPWNYAVAASVVLLVGLFFFNYTQKPIYEEYSEHEQAYFTERGDVNTALKQAEITFNAHNYKAAIPHFETALKESKTPEVQYFYGISLLEDNQYKKAETTFEELRSGTSAYKYKATWNLALSKLKQKDYIGCKEILRTIPQDYEDYVEVQILLRDLR
ncbi:tetratricopeptide repeat protein [Flavobacterium sp. Fl-318]|uniref:Tetratricopeptide repeat protein n=1 Tax=Flavobacterium cupriresistens TaxID=2893885 RepID=A0ABU4RHI7_9FLAO|nr:MULTISPECIES: tetratricopeptide repeat protein [unclassified Flavobacterium]MDX6192021.1 tetratricopeptide repeat protein [Flavobacterium sp. Fl-318]UFH43792.1 tetratricopeptide repeat protein [Flavobacterium sp. F-323]